MLMPNKNRKAIYSYLLEKGVIVAKKDFNAPKHPHVHDVPNLHVIKALQSMKSRGYVKEQFAWRHYYWYLTNEGIQYLRDYLHLPSQTLPETLKKDDPRKKVGKTLGDSDRAQSDRPPRDGGFGGGYRSSGYRAAGESGGMGSYGGRGGYGGGRGGYASSGFGRGSMAPVAQ